MLHVNIQSLSLIDDYLVDELRQALPAQMMKVVCATFDKDCQRALSEFEQACRTHDAIIMRKIAHRLKGIFAQFGAARAAAYAALISDGDEVGSVDDEFIHLYNSSRAAVIAQLQPA